MITGIEKSFSEFFELCRKHLPEKDLPKIQDAFNLLVEVFGDRKKKSGDFVLSHSISVARIVVEEIGLGVDTIIAAILHNIFYQDHSSLEIEARFGKSVTSILDGMAKINGMGTDTVELHSENYRKLMLALGWRCKGDSAENSRSAGGDA